MRSVVDEFKAFIMRGNVVDLAVAVVIGAAFTGVVTAFSDGILMALVAALFGQPSFDSLTLTINDAEILYGTFITALVNFLIIAFGVFLVVKGINALRERRRAGAEEEPAALSDEAQLLTEIRDLLQRQG